MIVKLKIEPTAKQDLELPEDPQAMKEALSYDLEKYGKITVLEVEGSGRRQTALW